MTITKAFATKNGSYPVLQLQVDGHPAYVEEPKLTLLAAGIVVLLDEDRHWEETISEQFEADPGRFVRLPGATRDPQIVALVRRFETDDRGNLLSIAEGRAASDRSRSRCAS